MPVDYEAVITELNTQEAELLNELDTLRIGRNAIIRLKTAQEVRAALAPSASKRFAGVGPKKAVLDVLKESGKPMTTSEIYEVMASGGWKTESDKPAANVSATLSQMKDKEVIKVGEAWRLKNSSDVIAEFVSSAQQQP